MSKYENTALIDREAEQLKQVAEQFHYKGELLTMLQNPTTALLSNEERVRLNKAFARELEKIEIKTEIPASDKKDLGSVKGSKETATKSFEFEKDTFKISNEGFEEVANESVKKNPSLKKFIDKGIRVKANTAGDVVEYMEDKIIDGEVKCRKGEQIFITYDAFIREVCKAKNCTQEEAENRYMMTGDELKEKMKDKPSDSDEYKKFFNKEVNGHLAGYRHPNNKGFNYVGRWSNVWLVGGGNAKFSQNRWRGDDDNRNFGFSGRLLKN